MIKMLKEKCYGGTAFPPILKDWVSCG